MLCQLALWVIRSYACSTPRRAYEAHQLVADLVVIHKVVNRSLGQGSTRVVSVVVGKAPSLVAYLTDLGVCEDSRKNFLEFSDISWYSAAVAGMPLAEGVNHRGGAHSDTCSSDCSVLLESNRTSPVVQSGQAALQLHTETATVVPVCSSPVVQLGRATLQLYTETCGHL